MGIADKTNVKLRQEKATPLAQAEVDGNFQEIRNVIDDVVQVDNDLGTYVLANDQRVTNVETDLDTKVKVFDTVALMKAASLSSGDLVTTKGYHSAGDGGQARYLIQTSKGVDALSEELSNGNWAVMQSGVLLENITVYIPSDYPSLQAAIDDLSKLRVSQGVTIELMIESGHPLMSGFRIDSTDASHIRISSVDSTVTLSPSFTFVSNSDLNSDVPRSSQICFLAVSSKMPEWNILVNIGGVGASTGYELDYGSTGIIRAGKGCINNDRAGGGVNARVTTNSEMQGAQSNFSGCSNGTNIAITLSSRANLQDVDARDAGKTGIDVSRGSDVYARNALLGGCDQGAYSRRSKLVCQGADFTNCADGVWASQGSHVASHGAIFDGNTNPAKCDVDSYLGLTGATKSGANLEPSDVVVGNANGREGTSSLKKFNMLSGGAIVSNANYPTGHAEYVSAYDSLGVTAGRKTDLEGVTFHTIIDSSSSEKVYSGSIYGHDVGVRVTVDGVVVLNDNVRAVGLDSSGNGFSCLNLPPIFAKSSLKIEVLNRATTASTVAWKIYRG